MIIHLAPVIDSHTDQHTAHYVYIVPVYSPFNVCLHELHLSLHVYTPQTNVLLSMSQQIQNKNSGGGLEGRGRGKGGVVNRETTAVWIGDKKRCYMDIVL